MRLDKLFNRLNKEFFGGELDIPIFTVHYDPAMFGYHTVWDSQHIISIMAELPMCISAPTMAHEMIHQWQWDNKLPRTHGRTFRRMAAKIERAYDLDKGDI